MSRRPLILFALAIASLVVAGCSDASTAPRREDPTMPQRFRR